jgi:hypothetical protein
MTEDRRPSDVFSPEKRSSIMRSIGRRDTRPEMQLRRLLSANGFRYRLKYSGLPFQPGHPVPLGTACGFRPWVLLARTRVPSLPLAAFERRILARKDRAQRAAGSARGDPALGACLALLDHLGMLVPGPIQAGTIGFGVLDARDRE